MCSWDQEHDHRGWVASRVVNEPFRGEDLAITSFAWQGSMFVWRHLNVYTTTRLEMFTIVAILYLQATEDKEKQDMKLVQLQSCCMTMPRTLNILQR